jgi:hypothetical protein
MMVHKDMLGNDLNPGDIVVYPSGRDSMMVQRIARVVRSDEASGNLLVEIRSQRWVQSNTPTLDGYRGWDPITHLKRVAVQKLHRVMLIREPGEAEREVFEIPARADARFLRFSHPRRYRNQSNR